MTTNLVSLFSGVGGFDLGLERAGMKTVFQCEIDRHAEYVLSKHWPEVPRWDDVKTLTGRHIVNATEAIDVVAWGSPCQDLSVAGLRKGLSGQRSGLFHEGIRIIKEIREATNGRYPRISIWENVAGALSSNGGADYGAVLNEMAEAGAMVQEWRVLDAQYFGIPQRRRRVFLVSIFDSSIAERCPDPLLPFGESVRGNPEAREETRKRVADRVATGFGNSGFSKWRETETAITLSARDYKGVDTVAVEVFGIQGNVIGRQDHNGPVGKGHSNHDEPMFTLTSTDVHAVASRLAVRRLTPVECERLMGWPDDWTAGVSDSQRYKQCGNGVAAPVAEWVGEQVMKLFNEGEPNV